MTLIVVSASLAFMWEGAKRSMVERIKIIFFIYEYFNVASCVEKAINIRNTFGYQYKRSPRIPPATMILIGPTLKTIDAMTAAANKAQLIQSGKFSLTTLI